MKRHAMVVLLVCIIIFFYFIRRNYFQEKNNFQEGFRETEGITWNLVSHIRNANLAGICYNNQNNTLYVACPNLGCIYSISPSATAISTTDARDSPPMIMSTTTTIANTSAKLTANIATGPWGICCDSNGNLYVTAQGSSNIIKIDYSTITPNSCSPALFAGPPSNGGTNPKSMCCDSNNNIWVVFTTGNMCAIKYDSNGTLLQSVDLGFECSAIAVDSDNNVFVVRKNPGEVYRIDKSTFARSRYPLNSTSTLGGDTKGLLIDIYNNMYVSGANNNTNIQYVPYVNTIPFVAANRTIAPGNLNRTAVKFAANNSNPSFGNGQGFCLDPQGNLYSTWSDRRIVKSAINCVANRSYSSNARFPCKSCPITNVASCPVIGTPSCAANYALDSTSETCIIPPCVVGTNFSLTGVAPCVPCPQNATCSTATPDGIVCNANFTKTGTGISTTCQPAPCDANTFSSTGKKPCDPCPANNTGCPIAGTPTCNPNFTYNPTTKVCDPKPCTAGTNYSSSGNMPCTTCPPNSQCTPTGFTCSTGFELNTPTNTCLTLGVPCPIGSYSASGNSPLGTTTCTACPTGFTTSTTSSKLITDCKRTITPQDLLTWLTTNNFNITNPTTNLPANAKYYGLTIADFTIVPGASVPMLASGATYSGTIAEVESFLKPSIVAAATLNYANKSLTNMKSQFFLTNSQGGAVSAAGAALNIPTTSIPYTRGSDANKMNNIVNCTSMTDPKSCTYKWAGINGPPTANPCPPLNAWFDFDQSACVDALGKTTTTKVVCNDSSVYNIEVNACVPVRKPVKAQPPNTTGALGPGDYKDCKTIDQGDCTVQYTLGTSITPTNPCSGSTPTYDFPSRSCKGSGCCSLTAQQASADPKCAKYVKTTNSVIASKCTGPKPDVCCDAKNASRPQCASFYTQTRAFNEKYAADCAAATVPASGFQDYKQQFNLTMPPRIKLF